MVCYDLRFPIWSRNREDFDGILYVASWPTARVDAWSALLKARAIENQCYVAGVNRVGLDRSLHYCGASVIIDPYGKELATCGINCEGAASAEIDMVSLQEFRDTFPVLKDRD
jgi:predicted amidohydrolase